MIITTKPPLKELKKELKFPRINLSWNHNSTEALEKGIVEFSAVENGYSHTGETIPVDKRILQLTLSSLPSDFMEKYQPELILYRYKKTRKIKRKEEAIYLSSGMVHPNPSSSKEELSEGIVSIPIVSLNQEVNFSFEKFFKVVEEEGVFYTKSNNSSFRLKKKSSMFFSFKIKMNNNNEILYSEFSEIIKANFSLISGRIKISYSKT